MKDNLTSSQTQEVSSHQHSTTLTNQLLSIDAKRFADQLTQILATFERAREWADLSNSLQKLKRAIDGYPNEPVPVKKELAKRLA